MDIFATRFVTVTKVHRKFSIFDLEFISTPTELIEIINGIEKLPGIGAAARVKRALRNHLLTDFLFMLCVYPGIAMLCIKTGSKMKNVGDDIFITLAALQLIAWLFDIIENCYLLKKLYHPHPSSPSAHKMYKRVVMSKWAIAITGAICSVFGLLYFWIMGEFSRPSATVPFIVLIIIIAWAFLNNKVVKIFSHSS